MQPSQLRPLAYPRALYLNFLICFHHFRLKLVVIEILAAAAAAAAVAAAPPTAADLVVAGALGLEKSQKPFGCNKNFTFLFFRCSADI